MRLLILVTAILLGGFPSWAATPEGFKDDTNCVSFGIKGKILYLIDHLVTGVNCKVDVRFNKLKSNQYALQIVMPIEEFKTGNSWRDARMHETLGSKRSKNLTLVSESHPLPTWKAILRQPAYQYSGYLAMAGSAIPLPFLVVQSSSAGVQNFTGFGEFKFTDFNLRPPSILGGLLVKMDNYVRLDFRFFSNKVEGFDALGPQPNLLSWRHP